jgi:hypothetical protein
VQQTWRILHRVNGSYICGPCSTTHNKSSCTWSSRRWVRKSVQINRSKICHSVPLSSQCNFQRLAPRLVAIKLYIIDEGACLTVPFVFFSRADSDDLLTVINDQVSDSTLSINQSAKNVVHNQVASSSRVSSAQDDPDNCFNKLHLCWKTLCDHRDTDLYWFFDDDPASLHKNSGIITEWLLLLLVELDMSTPPGVKWTGHSLRRGDTSVTHTIGVSIVVIMVWG